MAPIEVAMESDKRASRALGIVLPFINPACWATPIIVPVVSKIVTSRKEKTTAYKLCWITSPIASNGFKMMIPSGSEGNETNPWSKESCPVKKAIRAVIIMPKNKAPLIPSVMRINVTARPTSARMD